MEKATDFDSTVYHNRHYFLVGMQITDSQGEVTDPEIKMQVLTRCILHLHKKSLHK
ncbi:MAG: hypothetical protein ACOC2H_06565 [Spirochaetota bacterium]